MMGFVTTTTPTIPRSAKTRNPHVDEDQLVREHLPLARRVVAELVAKMPRHAPKEDLLAAGMAGLAQAARNFDPGRGVPFHRYALTRVRGALLDELRVHDWASRPVRAKARQMDQASERLVARLGRPPTADELATEMKVPVSSIQNLNHDVHRAVVLNYESILEGDSDTVLLSTDDGDPEGALLDRERNAYLVDAVRALPERLRTVVVGYFFQNRSMQELGAELSVSESRISQLRAEALDLLKDGLNAHLEPSLLAAMPNPGGRVARRRESYYAAIASRSTARDRLDSRPRGADGRVKGVRA
jgi:RNA polymerase sigma factor for flagellar operon FliA